MAVHGSYLTSSTDLGSYKGTRSTKKSSAKKFMNKKFNGTRGLVGPSTAKANQAAKNDKSGSRSIDTYKSEFNYKNKQETETIGTYTDLLRAHGIYQKLNIHNNFYRFGFFNRAGTIKRAKEYLFFTRPDLYIVDNNNLRSQLDNIPYWKFLIGRNPEIIDELQLSSSLTTIGQSKYPFIPLLSNQVSSNLEIPALEGTIIDSAVNSFGVSISYRGTSEPSNDSLDFTLEFKDTKDLPIYYFFRSYEEYEIMKRHGTVWPKRTYILNKILHDQFSVYKFIVDEDNETILYWGKYYGLIPKNLPRDSFSTAEFDSGLSYSINFRASFYEDMKPEILVDFNDLVKDFVKSREQIPIYNYSLQMIDGTPAICPYVNINATNTTNKYGLKLEWYK